MDDGVDQMTGTVREMMTVNPVGLQAGATLVAAARTMRDRDIGNVFVLSDGHVLGIVTDRDLTVRGMAGGLDPSSTTLGAICSREPVTVTPDRPIDDAVELMREKAIRRLPVVENGRPVGVVSLGDLSRERDPGSALADISTAQPDRQPPLSEEFALSADEGGHCHRRIGTAEPVSEEFALSADEGGHCHRRIGTAEDEEP